MTIERLTGNDVMELRCDVSGTSMQVAGVLRLADDARLDASALRDALAERVGGVRRLRQRVLTGPPGSGRPAWTDDPTFDIEQHVGAMHCAAPGDQQAMWAVVAEVVTRRLPAGRPLWSATLIDGLADRRCALVLVFHHALADGIGGLAVLADLMDGTAVRTDPEFPRRPPSNGELFLDALGGRANAVRRLRAGLLGIRLAASELGAGRTPPAPRCSLNRPIGTRRSLAATTVSLATVKAAGRVQGGTVNDVILSAVAGALGTVLAGRDEDVRQLVVSVPVSARRSAGRPQLGNQVGVIPMAIPTGGESGQRLARIAHITRSRKTAAPGASAALLSPVFRALAGLGIFGWFINHQHRVNTFVTDVPGPTKPMTFLGYRVTDIAAVPMITGNIGIAFAALSYAGRLQVSIIADPTVCPDVEIVVAALRDELAQLTATVVIGPGSGGSGAGLSNPELAGMQ
ncbi:MAG: wax ester/triacylglycerol synthase domain-containing protein [Nakamurella sp.]